MRLTIVGKNPRADGSECVIFGHFARDGAYEPVTTFSPELSVQGGWELRPMRPGAGLAIAPALVGWSPGADSCRTTGRLVLVSHRWSGLLQINNVGRKYVVDLFSDETRLVLLDAVDELLVDITALATTDNAALRLPRLDAAALAAHVAATGADLRFLDRDPDFRPGLLRQTAEFFRRPPRESLKLSLLAARLPSLASQPTPAPDAALRDELRFLAAAVEGLALRARA